MPTNLYGPGDKFHPAVSHVIPALIKKCVDAEESGSDHIEVWGTGSASREFLYVEDAAEAVLLAAEHYDADEPVNLGTDEEMPIRELVGIITEEVGFDGEVRWDTSKPDGQPRRRVDPTRARRSSGSRPKVDFREGLRRTIDWYRANRELAESRTFNAGQALTPPTRIVLYSFRQPQAEQTETGADLGRRRPSPGR